MDQSETLALYARAEAARAAAKAESKDDDAAHAAATAVWNGWANELLGRRQELEEAGTWEHTARVMFSTPTSAHTFEHGVDCHSWIFPGDAVFDGAVFAGTAWFGGATFTGEAWFLRASFTRDASFHSATFRDSAWFEGATFTGPAWFGGATITGAARFAEATFSNAAQFDNVMFASSVGFVAAMFNGTVRFHEATFMHDARFVGATFTDDAVFVGATFKGNAWLREATFMDAARFDAATFECDAWFGEATFKRDACFRKATFGGDAGFDNTLFNRGAGFEKATFKGAAGFVRSTFAADAQFGDVVFSGAARFAMATFKGYAFFRSVTFARAARFEDATFTVDAEFDLVEFNNHTTFERARFQANASFQAVGGRSAFSLEGARFRKVPDFIQANFGQAPRLDNVIVRQMLVAPSPTTMDIWQRALSLPQRLFSACVQRVRNGDRAVPARYRALKRLAIQGHDLEREQMFHAGEIRASRFTHDWPLHYRLWSSEGWTSVWRFWFGLVYEVLSDFGRSVLRPALAWLLLLAVSFAVYLGAHPDVARERAVLALDGRTLTLASAYATTTVAAWQRNQPCVSDGAGVQPLPPAMRAVTSAVEEALHLAFANGAVLGDVGSPDTGTRTYGCLYGLAPTSDTQRVTIVPYPAVVSTMSKIQKAFSALLIFLFGLAVRNMLKMK